MVEFLAKAPIIPQTTHISAQPCSLVIGSQSVSPINNGLPKEEACKIHLIIPSRAWLQAWHTVGVHPIETSIAPLAQDPLACSLGRR